MFKSFVRYKTFDLAKQIVRNMSEFSYKKVCSILDIACPASLAASWDNTGLLLEPSTNACDVKSILLTNDLTEPVLDEAVAKNVKFIISYHPPLFIPFKRITQSDWKQRIVAKCLANGIAIYSPHTRFDDMENGINDWLSLMFTPKPSDGLLKNVVLPICPHETLKNAGEGRVCSLAQPITIDETVKLVKNYLGLSHIQLAIANGKTKGNFLFFRWKSIKRDSQIENTIEKIAICAGSGAPLLRKAKDADLYLTGEMKHHEILDAIHNNVTVILCGHCNSERGFLKIFAKLLKKLCPTQEIFVSETDSSPFITV